jgi:type IV secretory pathway TraG/TraD family ATPase VirD4
MPPIRSKKIFYYQDKFFTERLLPPTFVPTQKPYDAREKRIVSPLNRYQLTSGHAKSAQDS